MNNQLAAFLAATSIVSGVLVVWAQLWRGTANEYASRKESTTTAEVGLAICYLGAWAGLLSLTIALISLIRGCNSIPSIAIGLFGFSLFLLFWEVLQSLISVTLRLRGERIIGPTQWAVKLLNPKCIRISIIVLIFLAGLVSLGFTVYAILNI
jgi:hypothetical protein